LKLRFRESWKGAQGEGGRGKKRRESRDFHIFLLRESMGEKGEEVKTGNGRGKAGIWTPRGKDLIWNSAPTS
jgi:hypothetical protein